MARYARSCGIRLRRPHLRCAPSPGILFRAVKMRLLRHQGALPPTPFPPARWDAKTSVCVMRNRRAGRAPGDPRLFFSRKLFLGSEGEVASLLTKPRCDASHGELRPCFSQNKFGGSEHADTPALSFNETASQDETGSTPVSASRCAMILLHSILEAVRARFLR